MDTETSSMIKALGLGTTDYATEAKRKETGKLKAKEVEQLQKKVQKLKDEKKLEKKSAKEVCRGFRKAQSQVAKYLDCTKVLEEKYASVVSECKALRKELKAKDKMLLKFAKSLAKMNASIGGIVLMNSMKSVSCKKQKAERDDAES